MSVGRVWEGIRKGRKIVDKVCLCERVVTATAAGKLGLFQGLIRQLEINFFWYHGSRVEGKQVKREMKGEG
jgi:hypothetical protein